MIPESFFQFENPFSIKLGENRRRSKLQHTTYITSRHTSIAGSGNSFNGFPNKHLTQNIDTTSTLDLAQKEMVGDKTKEDEG